MEREPLRDRKRRQTAERIVECAYALFAARGFEAVTVDEIAERAEVGRTTFFRYFGDKQEVVFHLDSALLRRLAEPPGPDDEPLRGLHEALVESRRLLAEYCVEQAADLAHHAAYVSLITRHAELADRHNRKITEYSDILDRHLRARGVSPDDATLAAQITAACYRTAWMRDAGDPRLVAARADEAFAQLLDLR
jgi:AcrR family transcriptional regulator